MLNSHIKYYTIISTTDELLVVMVWPVHKQRDKERQTQTSTALLRIDRQTGRELDRDTETDLYNTDEDR